MISYNIPQIQNYLKNQPVKKAWLFGSCSRGEETPESDIDLFVEYNEEENITLFTISRMMCALRKLLKRQVDLIEVDSLLPFAIKSAMQDRILIYEGKN